MANWPWDVLEIERTDDVAAVRSAYATKLKALNLDQDTQAYMNLRTARDEALWQARNFDAYEANFDDDAEDDAEDETLIEEPIEHSDQDASEPYFEPWEQEQAYHNSEHEQALSVALYDEDSETPLTPDEQTKLIAHIDALLNDPQMELIDHAGQIENWLASTLSYSLPRADPLIYGVSGHFGWMARKDEIGLSYPIAQITQRIALSQFIDEVQVKHHRFHGAWAELTKVGTSRRGLMVQKLDVKSLLAHVRDKFPEAEAMFDPDLVRKWDSKISGPGKSVWSWGLAIFVGLQLLLALGRCGNDVVDTASPPSISLPTSIPMDNFPLVDLTDINYALEAIFGDRVTVLAIKAKQSKLEKGLNELWTASQRREDKYGQFRRAVAIIVSTYEQAAIPKSSLKLITDRRRYELDVLMSLTTSECAAYVKTAQYPRALPEDLQKRRLELAIQTLLEVKADPAASKRPAQFSVSQPVIDAMVKKSGITFERIKVAFAGKGSDAELCGARTALLQATLAQKGKEALTLLREM